jgi:hypothetical protein
LTWEGLYCNMFINILKGEGKWIQQ